MAARTLALPARLDATSLNALLDALKAARGADLDLDGSAVDRINGQGLQLLVSASRTWRQDQRRLRLVEPSPGLLETLQRLGFETGSLPELRVA